MPGREHSAGTGPGCGPVELPVFEQTFHSFTPVEQRLSGRPYFPIAQGSTRFPSADDVSGFEVLTPTASPPGRPLQDVLVSGAGTGDVLVTLLYASKPVGDEETLPEFLARDGVVMNEKPVSGIGAADDVVAEIQDRAFVVMIGPHEAALVHADPVGSNDVRPYNLYWSDGLRDLSISGVLPPENVIEMARSLYCA
jgi:hypothetical protein